MKIIGRATPITPRYLPQLLPLNRQNIPGVVPWPQRPPIRPTVQATHIIGSPNSSSERM